MSLFPLMAALLMADPSIDLAGLTLDNGRVFVTVAPDIGRIYAFGPTGGESLLWTNDPDAIHATRARGDYVNYGGDKVWESPQSLWPHVRRDGEPWPPPGPIDGGRWMLIESSDRHAVMESPLSAALGVQLRRTVRLADDAPRVTIVNQLIRYDANPLPVHVWTISQTRPPRFALLDRMTLPGEKDYAQFFGQNTPRITLLDDALQWTPVYDETGGGKIGTFGTWIAGVYDDLIFLQHAAYLPGAMYVDRSSIQVYSDENFLELETLSPTVHLHPGESLTHTVTWQLLPRPADLDATALPVWLRKHVP